MWALLTWDLISDGDCFWKVDPPPSSASVLRKSRSPFCEQLIFLPYCCVDKLVVKHETNLYPLDLDN